MLHGYLDLPWNVGVNLGQWFKDGNLEFDQVFVEICWNGIRGMERESFLKTVEFCKSKFPNPDFIIIHLGSSD